MKTTNDAGLISRFSVALLLTLLGLFSCSQPLEEWEWVDEAGPLGKTFRFSYEGNGSTGGTPPSASSWMVQGDSVMISAPGTLAKTGYSFAGWNSAADGGGSLYMHSAYTAMPNASLTLYAQWFDTGTITTVAGGGLGDDGGPATAARLENPYGVAVGPDGALFIADTNNQRIRKVDSSGVITTIAGTGSLGFSGDGGPATDAKLYSPTDVVVDASGAVFIADSGNHRIRRIDSGGTITTIAGTGSAGYSGDGGAATSAMLYSPRGIALGSTGAIYIADYYNERVRKIVAGVITTVAGNGNYYNSGDGGLASSAGLDEPREVAVDANDSLYIVTRDRIRKVAGGVISTVVGGGAYSPAAGLRATVINLYSSYLADVAVDEAGRLYFSYGYYSAHRIFVVEPNGLLTILAGTGSSGMAGDGGPANAAQLSTPRGLVVDSSGDIYFADSGNYRIRKISF